MQIYIVALLVSVILLIILFFALRSTVKRINYNVKKYFVDKLQDYDYLIEEKQQVLDELNKKIEENKKNLSNTVIVEVKNNTEKNMVSNKNASIPKYVDKDLFKKYKSIKENFNFDYENVIREFIEFSLTPENEDYNIILNIKNKFTNDVIFKIMSLRENEQKEYVYSLLNLDEKRIIEKFIKSNNFIIKKIISNLDTFLEKNDPIVYVYTGDRNINYNHIDSNIKTVYEKNINEGIRIYYKGILYDYSL